MTDQSQIQISFLLRQLQYLNSQRMEEVQKKHYEKAYNHSRCMFFIKDALSDMDIGGHDFYYSTKQPLKGKCKQMRRNNVYLRFNCPKCIKNEKRKRFTSTLGTVSILFQIKRIQYDGYNPWLLIFKLKIYGMKCKLCDNYGQPQIYDSQLQKIQEQFCKIVSNIINKVPRKKRQRNQNPIKVPDLKIHDHHLCQACKLKKCHPGSCSI